MKQFSTHYDNLQVARNADAAVVAAAYRSLSLKHHPDRNQGNARSEEIMRILNRSYAVLSDPAQRLAHDKWIERMEAEASQASRECAPDSRESSGTSKGKSEATLGRGSATTSSIKRAVLPLGIAGFVAVMLFISSTPQPSGLPDYEPVAPIGGAEEATDGPLLAAEQPVPPALPDVSGWGAEPGSGVTGQTGTEAEPGNNDPYLQSDTAPNGSAWPSAAGYIKG